MHTAVVYVPAIGVVVGLLFLLGSLHLRRKRRHNLIPRLVETVAALWTHEATATPPDSSLFHVSMSVCTAGTAADQSDVRKSGNAMPATFRRLVIVRV
jgi:hypothetical protein